MAMSMHNLIQTVIVQHIYNEWHVDEAEQCMCGKCGTSYPAHVADMMIAAMIEDGAERWKNHPDNTKWEEE